MSIVIPACNTRPQCQKLLDDLLNSIQVGEYDCPVIVCFDSTDQFFVRYFTRKYPFITAIHNKMKAFGFGKNANMGLYMAHTKFRDDGVFVVNQDTVLPHSKYLYWVKNEGMASPQEADLGEGLSVENLNNLNEKTQFERHPITVRLAGFCMWLSTPLLDKVGYLDDGYVASFEDDDMCCRAKIAGFPVESTNVRVHHYIKDREAQNIISTTGAYDGDRLFTSHIRFRLKWKIPAGVLVGPNVEHHNSYQWITQAHTWHPRMKVEMIGVNDG